VLGFALSFALAFGLAPARPAAADEAPTREEQARAHFTAGQIEYRAGRYGAALEHFKVGYALSPRPEFLINFAQTYRKLGEYERAIVECERYLATAPPAELAEEARRLAANIREEQAARSARAAEKPLGSTAPANANANSNSSANVNPNSHSSANVNPNSHSNANVNSNSNSSANVNLNVGVNAVKDARGSSAANDPWPIAAPAPPRRSRAWVWGVAVGAVVVVIGVTVALAVTLAPQSEVYPNEPLGRVSFR